MNVLVIDPDRTVTQYFQRFAEKIGGIKVYSGSYADDVDKILKVVEMDSIICDVDGPDTIEYLISNKHLIFKAVVNLISNSDGIDKYGSKITSNGMTLGVCLRKPVDPYQLLYFLKEKQI